MATEYEVTYILRPGLDETEAETRSNAIADQLKANGGEILGELERMGKRRLAYEIDDVREGHYVVMRFKAEAAAAKELDRLMRLNEDVLRALIIRADELPVRLPPPLQPQAMNVPLTPPQPFPADHPEYQPANA